MAQHTVTVRGAGRQVVGARGCWTSWILIIAPGEFVALLGRSGSGKSTLLRVLAGLDREVDGEITVRGTVSVAFQQPRLLPWRRVWRNVSLGLHGRRPARARRQALAEVQLADRPARGRDVVRRRGAARLPGPGAGPRTPDLLLLDEPFGALDALTRLAMHRLVDDLWQRHRPSVLLVTHDVDEALGLADRVLVLDGGRIVAEHGRRPRGRPRARRPGRTAGPSARPTWE